MMADTSLGRTLVQAGELHFPQEHCTHTCTSIPPFSQTHTYAHTSTSSRLQEIRDLDCRNAAARKKPHEGNDLTANAMIQRAPQSDTITSAGREPMLSCQCHLLRTNINTVLLSPTLLTITPLAWGVKNGLSHAFPREGVDTITHFGGRGPEVGGGGCLLDGRMGVAGGRCCNQSLKHGLRTGRKTSASLSKSPHETQ